MTQQRQGQALSSGRRSGVSLHITSLPGRYGIGEIGAQARHFVDRLQAMQMGVWQLLPTGPTGYGDSPYQSLSTFAGNEMLIDIGDLVERGMLRHGEPQPLEGLPESSVDYGKLIPVKNALLKIAAGRFAAVADSTLKSELDDFLEANDRNWLHDYALFRMLKTRHGERPWSEWQPEYVHRDSLALHKLEADAGRELEAIKIIQFLFRRQWQQLREYAISNGVRIFADLPIYIALDSADAWANPELLQIDRDGKPSHVAGVPPDYFSEDGQLWGNPLYAWEVHAADGYRWWIKRLQASTELADIIRIDHFRGFESYWSVPAGANNAREGAWLPGSGGAIFDAIKTTLGELPIVAEDLGIITPAVEALRDNYGLPGMTVLQFAVDDHDFTLDSVAENRVCYTGTHDNDTTLGWFRGSPDDMRSIDEITRTRNAVLQLTGGTPETIHTDLIKAAFATRARLAIAPLQDYLGLGSEARINTPGTTHHNWRWRALDIQLDEQFCDAVAGLVDDAGRA
jgi:4-alpha-glucanotransferase